MRQRERRARRDDRRTSAARRANCRNENLRSVATNHRVAPALLDRRSTGEKKMANTCENKIAVLGLEEDPESFVKKLSKAMFQLDLDNPDPKKWGEAPEINGETWYPNLVDQYREKGSYPLTYCILYPHKPYNRLGVSVPRFHVDTKWGPPQEELKEASKVFPDLAFHMSWWVEQDGPTGEIVIRNGE